VCAYIERDLPCVIEKILYTVAMKLITSEVHPILSALWLLLNSISKRLTKAVLAVRLHSVPNVVHVSRAERVIPCTSVMCEVLCCCCS